MRQAFNQYPQAYCKDHTRYSYFTDSGSRIELIAGQDGVTEQWITILKRMHIEEINMLRRGRSKGTGKNKLLSLELFEDELADQCGALIDQSEDTEGNYIARETKALQRQKINAAYSTFSREQKDLLKAVRFDHKSMTETAAALGISRQAVAKRLKQIETGFKGIKE